MAEIEMLAEKSLAHIRVLANEIGSRPSGSEKAAEARDYVRGVLDGLGYDCREMPVRFSRNRKLDVIALAAGLTIGAAGILALRLPWVVVWMPLAVLLWPQLSRWTHWRRPETGHTKNLVSLPADKKEQPTIVFCAHLDSAPASAFTHPFLLRLRAESTFIYQRVAIAISAVAGLVLLGIPVPLLVEALVAVAGVLVGGWLVFEQLWQAGSHNRQFSPGANDNASGVGVLLALAEAYAKNPPAGCRIGFLFTDAEEAGMYGARDFAEYLLAHPDEGQGVAVVNVDMVGVGSQLRVITLDGVLAPQKTDPELNARLFRAAPNAAPKWYVYMSGDHFPFAARKLPVAAVQVSGSITGRMAYHSLLDRVSTIEPGALEMTLNALSGFVDTFA